MGAFQILDLIIGMAFVYFLLSLICVALQEIKARAYNERSKNLKKWIFDTFRYDREARSSEGLASRLWNNIIIDGLTQEGRTASYIPRDIFVSALLDEIHYESDDKYEKLIYQELQPLKELQAIEEKLENFKPASESGLKELEELKEKREALTERAKKMGLNSSEKIIERMKELDDSLNDRKPYDFESIGTSIRNSDLLPQRMKRAILQIYQESHSNMDSFRERLERWFDQAMERNAGTFKKKAQQSVLIFSIFVAVLFNVDSIELIRYFYDHPTEAARIADAAEKMMADSTTARRLNSMQDSTTKEMLGQIRQDINKLQDLKLPIGWEQLKKQMAAAKAEKEAKARAAKEAKAAKKAKQQQNTSNKKPSKQASHKNTSQTNDPSWLEALGNAIADTACLFWAGLRQNLMGWLITILAVSLGAPFWYDILNKLVDLRSAGKKPAAAPAAGTDSNKNVSDNPLG